MQIAFTRNPNLNKSRKVIISRNSNLFVMKWRWKLHSIQMNNNYRMRGFHIIIISTPNSMVMLYHRKQMQTLKVNNLDM